MSSSISASKIFAKSRSWWLALMAIGGGLYFFIAILALHILPTGLNPMTQLISDYANSSFGFLQATAFLVWSIGWLALAIGLYWQTIPSRSAIFAQVLFGIAAIAMFVNGIVPCDAGCANVTTAGVIHSVLAFPFFFGTLGGILLLGRPFKQDPKWQSIQTVASAISAFLVVATIAFFVIRATNLPFFGLGQRVCLAFIMLWYLLTTNRLRSIAAGSTSH